MAHIIADPQVGKGYEREPSMKFQAIPDIVMEAVLAALDRDSVVLIPVPMIHQQGMKGTVSSQSLGGHTAD